MFTQLLLNGIATGAIYSLVGVALGISYRTCGFLDFGHAAFFAIGAYATLVVNKWLGVPLLTSAMVGIIAVGGCAAGYHRAVVRPMQRRNARGANVLMASVGVFVVFEGLLLIVFGAESKSFPQSGVGESMSVLGGKLTKAQLTSVLTACFIVALWRSVMRWTRTGLVWRALASDRELARIAGGAVGGASCLAFSLACATAGLAGILQANDTGLSPSMGFGVLLIALVAVVIGGKSVVGNTIAAYSIAVLQQVSVILLPTHWQDAVVFLVLAIFLAAKPGGFIRRPGESGSA